MKYIPFLYCLLGLIFLLLFVACDPVHVTKYTVTIPNNTPQGKTLRIDTNRLTDALNTIDNIATKHGMVRRDDISSVQNGLAYRYYFGQYVTHGLAASSQKSVRLKIVTNDKTGDLVIEISGLFSVAQSQLSKDIERDLVDAMKQKYGEISIRDD